MSIALGLDLGTTSISAVAVDAAGRVVRTVTRNHGADVAGLPRGHAEQDPLRIRDTAWKLLRDLLSDRPSPPVGLGLTGQMHGVLLLDADRRPLSPLITWQDRRAVETGDDGRPTPLERLLARCDASALEGTGCRLAAGFGGTTLFTLQETVGLPPSFRQAATIIDWLAAELTDLAPVTDRSNAASLGLYDLQRDQWSPELLAAAKVAPDWLPPVRDSGVVIGSVTPAAAAATALPAGLPVCNAVGDNQAAVVGSVPLREDVVQINIGTGGQLARILPGFQRVDRMETRYLPPGRCMLVGAGLAGGDAYAWVRRTAAAWLEAFGVPLPEEVVYARLQTLLTDSPDDAAGLLCIPYFRGTRAEPQLRAAFQGVSHDNFTPGNVGRAVVNGIAAGMETFYRLASTVDPWPAQRIIATGNAVRRNPPLTQRISDVIGLPIDAPVHREEAAYGAALLAGVQTGLWSDLAAAGACIRHEPIARPRPAPLGSRPAG